MQVACTHCGTKHTLRDADLAGHPQVQFKCSKCAKTTVVEVRKQVDSTVAISPLPSFARAGSTASSFNLPPLDEGVKLPARANVVLTVIAGPSKNLTQTLKKPRVIVGREGADIVLNDPEISRYHCLLEVRETYANLKDMDSTNGTFYEEERVRAAMLLDGAEFRIGESIIRMNFQPK
jgi:pSer/pThr/pTyr-binding forkhead associated (FHA) protein